MNGVLLAAAMVAMVASGARAADVTAPVPAADAPGSALVERARQLVQERLRVEHPELTRVDIQPVTRSEEISKSEAGNGWVPVLPRHDLLAKRVVVYFESRQSRVVRRIPVWLAVSAYRPVVTTQRALRPGVKVGTPDLVMREMDVTLLDAEVLGSADGLTGLRARRYLPANTALRRTDLEVAPPVVREQDVVVRVAVGRVSIETRGVAQQDGRTGELIKIRNPANAEVYMAQVAGAGTVEIVRR